MKKTSPTPRALQKYMKNYENAHFGWRRWLAGLVAGWLAAWWLAGLAGCLAGWLAWLAAWLLACWLLAGWLLAGLAGWPLAAGRVAGTPCAAKKYEKM